jgi:hypothetical protein
MLYRKLKGILMSRKLEPRERRFLELVSTGSVAVGLSVAEHLHRRGLICIADGRYKITPAGINILSASKQSIDARKNPQ